MNVVSRNAKVALYYARTGIAVFPCKQDKSPLVSSWPSTATTDQQQIATWWQARPEALVGLPLKPLDCLVVDLDRHNPNEDGVAHWNVLCAGKELPPHPIVLTANNGEHRFFKQPSEKIGSKKFGAGLETRGFKPDNDGGYVIAMGSGLADGRGWKLKEDSPGLVAMLTNGGLPEVPPWLIEQISPRPKLSVAAPSRSDRDSRHEAYADAALRGCVEELARAQPGERNNVLNTVAFRMGTMVARGWIGKGTVADALWHACDANGLAHDDGADSVQKTLASGLAAGLAKPHDDLPERPFNGWGNGHIQAAPPAEDIWPVMDEAAYNGLAGDVVRTIEPHSESDPVAILNQFLTCAGNIIGNCPFYQVEGTRHRANLFGVLVGETAKARKGTSWDRISDIVKIADEQWHSERAKGGLSSGEGLINEVRDEHRKWSAKDNAWETVDPGISDKRLMVTEPEFAGLLSVSERYGNTISSVMRKAWDGHKLQTMTRSSPLCATGAHISLIGHITEDELRARLTRTDVANGFGNRFLFMLVKRSKVLPFGGDALADEVVLALGERLKAAVASASAIGRAGWTEAAADAWKTVYPQLSKGQPGLLGAVTSRAEAQCVRLALIYALLDGASNIGLPHIKAALAVWEYAEASAVRIFGASLGDPVADDILRALHQTGAEGMSRTAIRDYFGRHQSGDRIGAALAMLVTKGRARVEHQKSGGRPVETWFPMGRPNG